MKSFDVIQEMEGKKFLNADTWHFLPHFSQLKVRSLTMKKVHLSQIYGHMSYSEKMPEFHPKIFEVLPQNLPISRL